MPSPNRRLPKTRIDAAPSATAAAAAAAVAAAAASSQQSAPSSSSSSSTTTLATSGAHQRPQAQPTSSTSTPRVRRTSRASSAHSPTGPAAAPIPFGPAFDGSPSVPWRRGPNLEAVVTSSSSSNRNTHLSSTIADHASSGDSRHRDNGDMSAPATMKRRNPAGSGSGAKVVDFSGVGDAAAGAGSKTGKGMGAGTTTPPPPPHGPRFWQKNYLVAYNLVSAVLWAAVLGRVVLLAPVVGLEHVYDAVGEYTKWVQTGALLEVVHSLTGLVRAPLVTTAMQVASRLLLVWGVVDRHAAATAPSVFYTSMLVAWSVTEVIRYGYFVMSLKGGGPAGVPRALTWLRYNTFFLLYPVGIASECATVWRASVAYADGISPAETYALWAVLAVYMPGSYVLYTHMMAQRRRVLRAAKPARPRVDSVKSAQYVR